MRFRLGLVAAMGLCVVAGSWGAGPVDLIKVGWVGALAGEGALWGQSELNALKMLLDQANAGGGVVVGGKTYRFSVVSYNDRGLASEADTAAKRLVGKDRVTVIIGPALSTEALAVAKVAAWNKVPMIATTATDPKVTQIGNGVNPFAFTACFNDSFQGLAAATFAYKRLGARTAAIFVKSDDGGSIGLGEYFNQNFRWLGGQTLASVSFSGDGKDFSKPLSAIKAAKPDIIFAPMYDTEAGLMGHQARDMGISAIMMGGDGWSSSNLLMMAGDTLEGGYFVSHLDVNDPAVQVFRTSYVQSYGREPELPAYLANDALLMFFDALKRSQSLDGNALAQALESCDIQGITGRISIDKATHNPQGLDAVIIKIKGGKMVFQERFAAPR